jgi:hypothetical protein
MLSSFDCAGIEGRWKVGALDLMGRRICDAMLARVWPAMARGMESMLPSRSQRIGRARSVVEMTGG